MTRQVLFLHPRRRNQGARFSVLSLFANGEIGAWYDPSDLSTLFQDAAGTTPVTTAGDPVGLMLDKSQGLSFDVSGDPETFVNDAIFAFTNFTAFTGGFTAENTTGTRTDAYATDASRTLVLNEIYKITVTTGSTHNLACSARFANISNARSTFMAVGNQPNTTYSSFVRVTVGIAGATIGFTCAAIGVVDVQNVQWERLAGNHASQSAATARPTYQVESGLPYLQFTADDFMVTSSFAWGSDEAFIAAGVTKDNGIVSLIMELSNSIASNAGSFYLASGDGGNATSYGASSRGAAANNANQRALSLGHTAPITNVLASANDISGDLTTLRVDGVAATPATGDKGAGNFLTYPLYIGSRAGTSLFFNGRLYGAILRNLNPDAATIAQVEAYLANKSGVTLP